MLGKNLHYAAFGNQPGVWGPWLTPEIILSPGHSSHHGQVWVVGFSDLTRPKLEWWPSRWCLRPLSPLKPCKESGIIPLPSHMPMCPAPRGPDTPGGWAESPRASGSSSEPTRAACVWGSWEHRLRELPHREPSWGLRQAMWAQAYWGLTCCEGTWKVRIGAGTSGVKTRSALLPALVWATLFRGRAGYSQIRDELKPFLRHSALWNTLVPSWETMPRSSTLCTTKSPWGWVRRANRICGKGHHVPVDAHGVSTTHRHLHLGGQVEFASCPGPRVTSLDTQGRQRSWEARWCWVWIKSDTHRASYAPGAGEQGCTTYRCLCLSAVGGCWQHWAPREWPSVCGQCQSESQTPLSSPCCLVLDEGKMFATL